MPLPIIDFQRKSLDAVLVQADTALRILAEMPDMIQPFSTDFAVAVFTVVLAPALNDSLSNALPVASTPRTPPVPCADRHTSVCEDRLRKVSIVQI